MKDHTKSSLNEQVFNLMDVLRSPILTHSSSWADCIPKRLLDIIIQSRLSNLYKGIETASDAECVAFIMTASMEFPLSGEWINIYTHLSCKIAQEYWQEDHWKTIDAPRELSKYDNEQYLIPLRNHIYSKRRKYLKERMKNEIIKPIEPIEILTNKQPLIIEQQLTLF